MSSVKILSIDDSRGVHAYLDLCFQGTPHSLHHAMSGEEGLDWLGRQAADLIFLDWEMPGLTGPEVFEEISRKGIKTPVIMMTSKNKPSEIEAMLGKGVSEYVMKPFTPDIVFEKIESVLGIRTMKKE